MPGDLTLQGKTALVTGGSRGIGRAIVERLAAEGADVFFGYLESRGAADEVLAAARELPGEVDAAQADLGVTAEARRLYAAAEERFGALDVLVNNAGIGSGGATIAAADEELYERVLGVNARGPFFLIQEAARRMADGGRIVNVSTTSTARPGAGIALYAAGNAALEQFTAVAAKELGPRGITVNAVSPGYTDTDLLRGRHSPETLAALAAESPFGRLGTPEDIAGAVAFLVGPDGGWITGQNLRAAGGVV